MRNPSPTPCDDVARALTAPGAEADRLGPDLAEHLAACPRCDDALAGRGGALARAWDASRPVEPAVDVWDSVWAGVSARLDRPAVPATPAPPWKIPTRGRHGATAFVAAQAAAIFAAVVLWAAHRHPQADVTVTAPPAPAPVLASVPRAGVDIEPGDSVVIHVEGNDVRAVTLAHDDRASAVDEMFVWFNDAEAMAGMTHDAHAATPPG